MLSKRPEKRKKKNFLRDMMVSSQMPSVCEVSMPLDGAE